VTEASGYIWQRHLPYLVSVVCKWCRHSPHYRRTVELSRAELASHLGALPPASPAGLLAVATTSPTGRAVSVTTPEGVMRGSEFRQLLGLPSTRFTWEVVGNTVRFHVRGHGHGVGVATGQQNRDLTGHLVPGMV